MRRNALLSTLAVAVALALATGGCSDDNSYPNNPGGGGTREFVSGDLGNGASFTHTFATAGSYPYYCRYHGDPGGIGMSGVITVTDPPNASPVHDSVSITGNTLPDLSIKTGDLVTWTNNDVTVHTVESDN